MNPEWKAKADAEPGGSRVSNNPTAVWLDRIAAIEGTAGSSSNGSMGVRDHLDAALAQGAGYIQFVIYNLPGRDCAALASNGELGADETARYKTEYIDPIAAIQADPKYAEPADHQHRRDRLAAEPGHQHRASPAAPRRATR